jgi:hypothetical protein
MKFLLYIIVFLCSFKAFAKNSPKEGSQSTFIPSNIIVGRDSCYAEKLSCIPDVVYGFSIDGNFSVFQEDYLVRVLVTGKDGREYLVMESYREIQGNIPKRFEDYSEETFLSNGFNLDSIKVFTSGADLQITGVRYLPDIRSFERNKNLDVLANNKRNIIRNTNVEKINEYNERHKLLWRADTTWLSKQSFETKRRLLGLKDNCSTRGIEYYAGGIIEIDKEEPVMQSSHTSAAFVDNFDWRNRHGKNWMTHVKHQGNSNCCFLFACVGAVEALTNLYYNQKLDLNLSEQELISCSGLSNPYNNGTPSDMMEYPLDYLVNHGVCDSLSYPFTNAPYQSCLSGSITPNEIISISGYNQVNGGFIDENDIKNAIINHGPLVSGIRSPVWMSHAMVLVGYGILQAGDTIYHHLGYNYDTQTYFHDKFLIVDEDDPNIGRTYMVYKSSYGLTDNDCNLGYMYVIHNNYNTSLVNTYYLEVPITSLNYSTDDIVCEDADGDGYYFWGIGIKPSNCPSWIPDEPDGDDSDYQYGPMDSHGNLEDLELRALQTLWIQTDYTFTTEAFWYNNTVVCNTAKMTIKSPITLYGSTKIIVEPNGELVIDGGTLQNADIELNVGSRLVLKNGGTIIMRKGKAFFAPLGATVNIENGLIK